MKKTLLAVLMFVVACFTLAGCDAFESKTLSPLSGQLLTAPQLLAEGQAEQRRLEAERAKALSDARRKVRDIEATQGIDALKAKAAVSDALAEAEVRAGEIDTALASIGPIYERALEDIERLDKQKAAGLDLVLNNPFVKSAAASVGVDTGGLGAILGTGAGAWALTAWRGRKGREEALSAGKAQRDAMRAEYESKINAAWDDGHKAAHAERDRADAAFDEAESRALRLLATPGAKA